MSTSWRDIPEWVGIYQISDEGQVRRIGGRPRRRGSKDGAVKAKRHPRGYQMVALREKPRCEYWLIHQLVMLAFVGPVPAGHEFEINHKNGNKTDNRLENLEYVTSSENKRHASRVLGNGVGEQNWNCVITDEQVSEIRLLASCGITGRELAARYGVSCSHISRIINQKSRNVPTAAFPWREEFPL